ncbi:MAG: hypothetical protein WBQ20_05460, partial [Methyloceanibacter sp.]
MKRGVWGAVAIAAGILLAASGVRLDQAQARETVIVALGDSLTAGLGLPEKDSFPAQLEKALLARG